MAVRLCVPLRGATFGVDAAHPRDRTLGGARRLDEVARGESDGANVAQQRHVVAGGHLVDDGAS